MLSRKRSAVYTSLVVGVLCLALLFTDTVKAASVSGTTFVSGGINGQNAYSMRYAHYTGVRSTGEAENENLSSFNHYLEFVVPLEIRTSNDCFYNGSYRQKLNFFLRQNGASLYSIVQNFTIEYEPNEGIPTDQLSSTAYHSATGANTGYTVYWYLLAANFQCAADTSTEIGTFTFKFWLTSPLQELTGISLDLTCEDSTGDFDTHYQYDPTAGMSNAIVQALDYAFAHYSSNDFLRSVDAYLWGIDHNMYIVAQALADIQTQNTSLYNMLTSYLSTINQEQISQSGLLRTIDNHFLTNIATVIKLLRALVEGSDETEAQSELADSGNRLESAGANMAIDSPNISGELQNIQQLLTDQNVVAAQGTLFSWLTAEGWIVSLLLIVCILALFRFVLFGKR